ncbi:hypothetical protein SAMN05216548_11155 [Faunimonas pinastri]|uniref:Uncharacterized protein n=1 Tax=Faunimonas pinastri TaxID=1855383 RepID=A0A1H9LDL1_9HYPH|nr:hypothetical protein SAMN05216548_11155 [Faunimonas pinastri]
MKLTSGIKWLAVAAVVTLGSVTAAEAQPYYRNGPPPPPPPGYGYGYHHRHYHRPPPPPPPPWAYGHHRPHHWRGGPPPRGYRQGYERW